MKVTVAIPDFIYTQLRKRAAAESISIPDLIVRAIEQHLAQHAGKPRRRVELPIVKSKRPGKLRIDNTKIYNVISFP